MSKFRPANLRLPITEAQNTIDRGNSPGKTEQKLHDISSPLHRHTTLFLAIANNPVASRSATDIIADSNPSPPPPAAHPQTSIPERNNELHCSTTSPSLCSNWRQELWIRKDTRTECRSLVRGKEYARVSGLGTAKIACVALVFASLSQELKPLAC